MMLPATAPMILVFVSAKAQHERPTAVPTWTFVAGYLLVWLVAGAVVYVLGQVGSNLATLITLTDLVSWKPIALGAILVCRSWSLSVHATQASLPQSLSLSPCLRGAALA